MTNSRSDAFSRLLNATMALCALVLTAVIVRREFFPPTTPWEQLSTDTWEALQQGAHPSESSATGPTLIVFTDYECPACKRFEAATLPTARSAAQASIRVLYRHLPLSIHRHARSAALASLCADAQGRFEPMHRTLFAAQDSLGELAASDLAQRAGISDVVAFETCLASPQTDALLNRDIELARELNIGATPTAFFEGARLPSASAARLDSAFHGLKR